jgi:hypothetical protein
MHFWYFRMNKPIDKYYYFEFSDTLFLKLNYICNTLDPVLKIHIP